MEEKKVYVINVNYCDELFDFRQLEHESNFDAIKKEAEKNNNVYSLKRFQDVFNENDIFASNIFIYIE